MVDQEKTLTVLFADVAGSARLYEKLDDSAATQAVDRCLKRMERALIANRGHLVKNVGDELLAVFETVDEAFRAACEMQQSVSDLPPVSGVKLAIRVGFQQGSGIEEAGDVVGDCVNGAAQLAGLATPGQILICPQTRLALSDLLQRSTQQSTQNSGPLSLHSETEETQVFEVIWQTAEALAINGKSASQKLGAREARLCVRHAGQVLLLDAMNPTMSMGRDAGCEVVVRDRRASRNHARIELRGEKFVLIDQSTNGTYVTFTGETKLFLQREELVLRGNGNICFAALATGADADCAEFEHL